MLAELAALADWVGDGRAIDADAELSAADRADALSALDMTAERFTFLWKYAGAVDWIEETERRPGDHRRNRRAVARAVTTRA